MPETGKAEDEDRPTPPRLKQAVVVVHGMGEQLPMSTLRAFVDSVWTKDPDVIRAAGHPNAARIWISPDPRTGSHELRRIVSSYVRQGKPDDASRVDRPQLRTDFYELYWADLTQGTTRSRLFAWVHELLWRKRSAIPPDAMPIYRATQVMVVLFALIGLLVAVSSILSPVLAIVVAALATLLTLLVDRMLLPYLGDVASYARATPETMGQRAAVRQRGLTLLNSLSDDPEYDRIVLVGHSLGSILAYDLLQLLWYERRPRELTVAGDGPLMATIRNVGRFALPPGDPGPDDGDLGALRAGQWELYRALRGTPAGSAWKISDFVTVGSPLTHAEFIVANDGDELRRSVAERLFSTSPPQSNEAAKPEIRYNSTPRVWAVHHAACFAATRWTNIYDLGNLLWTGDPISGRLRENFGWGIREMQVQIRRRRSRLSPRLFTHTLYWSQDVDSEFVGEARTGRPDAHLHGLREALDLLRVEADAP